MATNAPVKKNVPSVPYIKAMLGNCLRGPVVCGGRRESRSPFGFRGPRRVLRPRRPRSPARRLSGVSRPSQTLHKAVRPPRGIPYAHHTPTEPLMVRKVCCISIGAVRVFAPITRRKPLKTT